MSSPGTSPLNHGISEECSSQAEKIRNTLGEVSGRIRVSGEMLRRIESVASRVTFLSKEGSEALIATRDRLAEEVLKLEFEMERFVSANSPVTVVIAGGFSSGKSTFLNGLLGIDLLEIADGPASKMVVSIKYGPRECYYHVTYASDDVNELKRRVITRNELKGLQLEEDEAENPSATHSELEIYLDSDILRSITLVDTPGLKAVKGEGGDTEGTIRAVTEKSDLLFWVLDANRGTIPKGDKSELKKLASSAEHPVIVLNKMDTLFGRDGDDSESKQGKNERQAVRSEVRIQLNKLFGKKGYTLVDYSAALVHSTRSVEARRREVIEILTRGLSEAFGSTKNIDKQQLADICPLGSDCRSKSLSEIYGIPNQKMDAQDSKLLKKKYEILDLLNEVISNRSSLMLRYNLCAARVLEETKTLESEINSVSNRLKVKVADEKRRIEIVRERSTKHFKGAFESEYQALLSTLLKDYKRRGIKAEIVEPGGGIFKPAFKGKIILLTTYAPHKQLKRNGIDRISKISNSVIEELSDYGIDDDLGDRFERTLTELTDALVREACEDAIAILQVMQGTTEEKIEIITSKNRESHEEILLFIEKLLGVLLDNKVLWTYCDREFVQEIDRSITRFFKELEDQLAHVVSRKVE